jgi:TRAP-type C4-dicarboxylate transport system substrate-binding protein
MKSALRSIFATLCIVAFAQVVCAAPVTIKLSTLGMEGSSQLKAFHAAEKEIAAKTGGEVIFKIYTGGAMGTGETLFRKIKFKQLDGGSFTAGEASEYCEDLRVPSIAFLLRSEKEVDYIMPILTADFEKKLVGNGYVPLAWVETGFSYMMSTQSITKVSDLQARSVWIPADDWVGQMEFKQFGVTPKPMSLSQATTGLMTGMIDTIEGPFIAAVGLQWINKVKYVFDVPLLYTYSVFLVSKDSFDKISPANQKIVRDTFAKHFQQTLRDQTRKDNADARKVLANKGIKFIKPDAASMKTFEDKMDLAVKEMEAKKVFTPGLIKKVDDMLVKFRAGK